MQRAGFDTGTLPGQQLVTLEEMLPHMRPGGVYLCEDIHNRFNGFAAYVQGLSDNLNESLWQGITHTTPSTFQAAINSIHLYPFAAVIEKCDRPVHEFFAPRHGTQWQPHSFWNAAKAVKARRCGAV